MEALDNSLNQMTDFIAQIMGMSDEVLEKTKDSIVGAMKGAFTANMRKSTIQDILKEFKENNLTRSDVRGQMSEVHEFFDSLINDLQPSATKREVFEEFFQIIYDLYEEASAMYMVFDIELPMTLSEGAMEPNYAHETDAAADLSANETITLAPHSLGNKIHTGVRIGLPVGWAAHIIPRSSIGVKTPLRLSNMQGLIDSDYRGEIMLLFDNISDSEYTINAGDRLAQMWVSPVYKFKPIIVSELNETERGEGGFGSTGQ